MKNLTILLMSILILGCSKDDKNDIQPDTQDPNAEFADNIVVIHNDISNIVSTESDLSNGLYKIQFDTTPPSIEIGDILVGDEGLGFIRRVSSISVSDNLVTTQTTQGNMEDVFGNVAFNISTDLSDLNRLSTPITETLNYEYFAEGVERGREGFLLNIGDISIYDGGGASVSINGGSIEFDPIFNFDFDYSLFSIDRFEFNTQNTALNASANLVLNSSGPLGSVSNEMVLFQNSKTFTTAVGYIPVVVTVFLKIKAKSNLSLGASTSLSNRFESRNTMNLGIVYEEDAWTTTSSLGSNFIHHPIELNSYYSITENVTFVPEIIVAFYGINGPFIEPELTGSFGLNTAITSNDWDASFSIKSDLKFGASIGILGETLETLPLASYQVFQQTLWNTPETMEIVSGNNQTGYENETLLEPLKVKILDSSGEPFQQIPVYFEVNGGGSVSSSMVITDEDGFAEVNWTIGALTENQQLHVKVKKANGVYITSTVVFNATGEFFNPLLGSWTAYQYAGLPIGQVYNINYSPQCPEIAVYDEAMLSYNLNFISDNQIIENKTIRFRNYDFSEIDLDTCIWVFNDYVVGDVPFNQNLQYEFLDNNQINVTYPSGWSTTFQYTLIDENTLSLNNGTGVTILQRL